MAKSRDSSESSGSKAREQRVKVTVYRTRTCPYCVQAEMLLRQRGIAFEEVMLDQHPDRQAYVETLFPGHRTVPLIMIGDEPIGGYTDLMRLASGGQLDAKVFGAG